MANSNFPNILRHLIEGVRFSNIHQLVSVLKLLKFVEYVDFDCDDSSVGQEATIYLYLVNHDLLMFNWYQDDWGKVYVNTDSYEVDTW